MRGRCPAMRWKALRAVVQRKAARAAKGHRLPTAHGEVRHEAAGEGTTAMSQEARKTSPGRP